MVEKNNKKTNFFKEVFKSVKDLDKYEDFAEEQPKKVFKYFFKLILIFAIMVSVFYSCKIVERLNNMYSSLKDSMPEFSYSNGELVVNEKQPIILENVDESWGKIIIDTSNEELTEEYTEQIKQNSAIVILLKNKAVVASNGVNGQVVYKYEDIASSYNLTEFTKQDLINYIDGINVVYICVSVFLTVFIYLFIVYFVSVLIDVLVLTIIALIVSRISKIKLKFMQAFSIGVHAITLPLILNLIYVIVNLLTGFNIKYFQFMYTTISYIYVIVAILMIKTDFINRQIELMKIEQEHEKIKQEFKKEKEEKKKEDKQEKEKKPKEKKKQKEDEENLEGGVNPSVIQEINK